ncbi:efflux RND transporter permease subunit [Bradyrhizobium sp. 191]|uniref:efflux RND transporter permease subunit n=1 Tax=Bradyrhizobium sp. 191 TaxID=2782659 RepID=UPI003208BCF4
MAKTVNMATVGDIDQNLSKFSLGARQIPVRILLSDVARSDMASLSMLQVPTFEKPVPLSSVADISFGSGPLQIERTDRTRSETIEAELGGLTVGEAENLVAQMPSMKRLPAGALYKPAGDSERMQELFDGFHGEGYSKAAVTFLVGHVPKWPGDRCPVWAEQQDRSGALTGGTPIWHFRAHCSSAGRLCLKPGNVCPLTLRQNNAPGVVFIDRESSDRYRVGIGPVLKMHGAGK